MRPFVQICLLVLIMCSCQSLKTRPHIEQSKFQHFETDISPLVVFSKQKQKFSIVERMRHYRVPGLTLAIIDRGAIVFAKSYGVKDHQSNEMVDNSTIFQAASVSKPISALGAVALVDVGKLKLDTDVNRYLKSWKLPNSKFTKDKKVTLRHILSHTAGLTVGGFLGYRSDEKIPTAQEILNGRGNSPKVVVDTVPGTKTRYSGGGTLIAQVMMEDVSGKPFADFMRATVLEPLAMKNSWYAQPLPAALQVQAAAGHLSDGTMVLGRYRVHPELAPAGLWTTAEDLANAIVAIQKAYLGMETTLPVSRATIHQMLTRQGERFGLGPKIDTQGGRLIFEHNGSNIGYKAMWIGFFNPLALDLSHSGGIVVLTNGDNGFPLIEEVVSAIGETMAWQFLIKDKKEIIFKPLTQSEKALVGVFDKDGDDIFITENDGILNFWGHEIYKVDDFTFVSAEGHHNVFKLSEDASALEVTATVDKHREIFSLKRKRAVATPTK